MTLNVEFADCPTLLSLSPLRWLAGCYTNEGVPDGHHGLRLDSGKWASWQPNGDLEERDSPGGPYEWVTLDEGMNVLRVTPHILSYAIAVRER